MGKSVGHTIPTSTNTGTRQPVKEIINGHEDLLGGPREEVEALFCDLEGCHCREISALKLDIAAQALFRGFVVSDASDRGVMAGYA